MHLPPLAASRIGIVFLTSENCTKLEFFEMHTHIEPGSQMCLRHE